eukprot:TRINITY_DN66808_c0_g1_i1.p1 TRINITY_DN66808_c0_g1~~TRINITY_DN66808_c0_g1_i1.p1  ORF type:complete len:289 (+),score=46.38 TRINITY_DN66808_c0_g1_i1:26-868(+)
MSGVDGSAHDTLEIVLVSLTGEEVLRMHASCDDTVSSLKLKIAESLKMTPRQQTLIDRDRILSIGDQRVDTLEGVRGGNLELQLVIAAHTVEFQEDESHGMSMDKDGSWKHDDERRHPCGWARVIDKDPLPWDGETSWNIVVDHVASCGDIIVGLQTGSAESGCRDGAFTFIAVGNPSGLLGINRGSENYGGGSIDHLRTTTADFAPRIPWSEGAGVQISASWDSAKALRIAVRDKHGTTVVEQPAFSVGEGANDILPGTKLYPFVTCYGRGTAVKLQVP